MKSEATNHFDTVRFNHRLRLIFTHYASQGYKQDPLFMREKSFFKFLNDSTISQILNIRNTQSNQPNSAKKSRRENKSVEILVNSHQKPMNFQKFVNIITKLLFQAICLKPEEEEQISEEQLPQDLFEISQQDEIVSGIFQYLYEQIEEGTEFGSLVVFSQRKSYFDRQIWKEVETHKNLLKVIYGHYFNEVVSKESDNVQDIMNVLKKFCLDFQVAPLKVSMTEVLVILWEVLNSNTSSVYEQNFVDSKQDQVLEKSQRWDFFPQNSFLKVLILIANLIQRKQTKLDKEQYGFQAIRNFLEYLGTTKGYKKIKSQYKINTSFYVNGQKDPLINTLNESKHKKRASELQNSLKVNSKNARDSNQLYFEPKNMGISRQMEILKSFQKFFLMIFKNYTQIRQAEVMSKKQVNHFCTQFKVIPHLISKVEVNSIYQKIITFQRNYFYLEAVNPTNPKEVKKIPEQNKLKISESTLKPQFGLKFIEFNYFIAQAAQLNKVSEKLTPVQRLIYWVQYLFGQEKAKNLMQKSRTRQKYFIEKDINLLSIYQRPKSGHSQNNFHDEHESMFKKLKKTVK